MNQNYHQEEGSQGKGELLPLLIDLRSLATAQPGYISGETLRSLDDPFDYLVISTWNSLDYWKIWEADKERQGIQGEIDNLLRTPSIKRIFIYS